MKNVMVYMIVIIFLPTSSMTDKVAGQYAMLAQIIDIVFICLLLMIFISVFSNVSDVAEYATFKAKTVAKIIKLGGVVIEPERPNRKRRATTK